MRILNQTACLSYLDELIERKVTGAEQGTLDAADLAFYQHEYQRLVVELESAHQSSHLPETATARPALHNLLLRVRTNPFRAESTNLGC